jgi:hypothetical protein
VSERKLCFLHKPRPGAAQLLSSGTTGSVMILHQDNFSAVFFYPQDAALPSQ